MSQSNESRIYCISAFAACTGKMCRMSCRRRGGLLCEIKMSGLRQVYKYITNTYPRPIATPIAHLRPARETCEKCHWPQKFYTSNIRYEKYFLADNNNTEWDIIMKMRIGAEHSALGKILKEFTGT